MISAFGVEHGEISKRLSRKEKAALTAGAATGAAAGSFPSFRSAGKFVSGIDPKASLKGKIGRTAVLGSVTALHPGLGGKLTLGGSLAGGALAAGGIGYKRYKKKAVTE